MLCVGDEDCQYVEFEYWYENVGDEYDYGEWLVVGCLEIDDVVYDCVLL